MDMEDVMRFLLWLFISCIISAIAFFFSIIAYTFIISFGLPLVLFYIFAGLVGTGVIILLACLFVAMVLDI